MDVFDKIEAALSSAVSNAKDQEDRVMAEYARDFTTIALRAMRSEPDEFVSALTALGYAYSLMVGALPKDAREKILEKLVQSISEMEAMWEMEIVLARSQKQ